MRLNSSARPRKLSDNRSSAPPAGRTESGLAYPLRPDSSLCPPQHTDLHKTLHTSPTAHSRTVQKTTHQSSIPGASQPNQKN
jgi:hypothetical protein